MAHIAVEPLLAKTAHEVADTPTVISGPDQPITFSAFLVSS